MTKSKTMKTFSEAEVEAFIRANVTKPENCERMLVLSIIPLHAYRVDFLAKDGTDNLGVSWKPIAGQSSRFYLLKQDGNGELELIEWKDEDNRSAEDILK